MNKTPIVAVIGRTNVGKSTLFNAIVGRRHAIVADIPQVTRDILIDYVRYNDMTFALYDTAGFVPAEYIEQEFEQKIIESSLRVLDVADVVLIVVDGIAGIHPYDEYITKKAITSGKNLILVVNKVDNEKIMQSVYSFYKLGIKKIVDVSAAHRRNIGDLLDAVTELLPEAATAASAPELNLAIVGKPNVGKSSLFNILVGHSRAVVSNRAGTTRDAIDEIFKWHRKTIKIVDTAGLRKKKRVSESIEYYSVLRAMYSVASADLVYLLIDAADGISTQDKKILEMILNANKAVILVVNKWDLIKKETNTQKVYEKNIKTELSYAAHVPVFFISCEENKNIDKLLKLTFDLFYEYSARIDTAELNRILQEKPVRIIHNRTGKALKLRYITQVATQPPKFVAFVNDRRILTDNYKRYLANYLRQNTMFKRTPFLLRFKSKKENTGRRIHKGK